MKPRSVASADSFRKSMEPKMSPIVDTRRALLFEKPLQRVARAAPYKLESNYSFLFQLLEFRTLQSEHLAINFGIMLAQQRCALDLGRRIFEFHWASGHGEFSAYRMIDGDYHS